MSSNLGPFVWSIADQLCGVYKPHQYGSIVLPFTILRRLDALMASIRDEMRSLATMHTGGVLDARMRKATGLAFYNTTAALYTTANLEYRAANPRHCLTLLNDRSTSLRPL